MTYFHIDPSPHACMVKHACHLVAALAFRVLTDVIVGSLWDEGKLGPTAEFWGSSALPLGGFEVSK